MKKIIDKYSTLFVSQNSPEQGAISPQITNSASFRYTNSAMAQAIFDGKEQKPLYARMGNPTTSSLENSLKLIDDGYSAIATASGMGAISMVLSSLVQSGDEVIAVGGLFGGTYTLLNETLKRFGVTTHFFEVDAYEAIENAINENTKIIYSESVGNPNLRLIDMKKIASIADKHGVLLVIDNTLTPLILQPLQLGADITVYSTTKIITGNASALGGAAIFREVKKEGDKLHNKRFSSLAPFVQKAGANVFFAIAKKRALRDFGMSASGFNSYLTLLGLETLPLRLQRVQENITQLVKTLHENGVKVNHPSLPLHQDNKLYIEQYPNGTGALFTIECEDAQKAFKFLDDFKQIHLTVNIGDTRTLALHMRSTIYRDFDDATCRHLGITDGLVRFSMGIEDPEIIADEIIRSYKKNIINA